ncbi:type VI secretion system membrane subunit TssM [Aliivibrio fischeri]|uniref:type VI secretion system membrane subunit TssM n=1 Tax=Aliivibrio fischeri TaxID=668 RepID=UPI0012DA2BE6|nr:type VI secretion system membrane subunit TssM [Aliivibrio fischeri]MUK40693.1 type VI secretion system membrane subunit TssM [Aliivibrio fischeri]
MIKNTLARTPFILSTVISAFFALLLVGVYYLWFNQAELRLLWGMLGVIFSIYAIFNLTLYIKKRKSKSHQNIETEENTLSMVLKPLLNKAGKKPVYLVLGNKGSGKNQFLNVSNAIKPMDKVKNVKNDFFEWSESDSAVYIKPNHRLTFQEISSNDSLLWDALINEVIKHKPRKPFAGCMLLIDFEFLIVHDDEQTDYTLNALLQRLESIKETTGATLPLYLIMTKLDKLEGFKEYIHFSPLKSSVEFLAIPLKDAKGAILDYFRDSYKNIVKVMESNALDSSSYTNNPDEKQTILAFPKQFELCEKEISRIIERLNELNQGTYSVDIREVFFSSSLQGGRKYNLLAKSCSNYFNLPIIASEHGQLTETPYFTRFLVDAKVLPESDYSAENQHYLKRIQQHSRIAFTASAILLTSGGYFLFQALDSNLRVINQLIQVEDTDLADYHSKDFTAKLINAQKAISPTYSAWLSGNRALDEEMLTMNVSRLEPTTKIAYNALIAQIDEFLMPVISEGYENLLTKNQNSVSTSLPLLKGYLMLNDPSKRDIPYLKQQTFDVLSTLSNDSVTVENTMNYLDAYFRTQFAPIDINMDLVRATRRSLLAKSNVDLVYAQILDQAKSIDLDTLDIQRAVGFDFTNIFEKPTTESNLQISKVYTASGFSSFYRPHIDLLSKRVIADNWVLGLSQHIIPTDDEQKDFKSDVRKKYTDDYINYWRNALSELKIKNFSNIYDLNNAIDLISGPSSPMTTVLKQLYSNTQFSSTADITSLMDAKKDLKGALETATDAVKEIIEPDYVLMSRVEQAFTLLNQLQISETKNSPTPWDDIVASLNQVRTYVKDIADSPNVHQAALDAARARMNRAEADPLVRLKQIAQKSPEPVRSWLLDIVNQTWSVMIVEATKGIQTRWYSEVYSIFKATGLNRYPFNTSATEEISLEDFEQLFATGGVLDVFIKDNLAPFYDINLWTAKRVDGQIMYLSPQFLVQLKNYNIIRNTMINKSTNKVFIPFNAKVIDLDSSAIRANINFGSTIMSYYHGPSKVQELQWPPKGGDFEVKFTLQDVTDEGKQHTLSKNGQWAIYRLLGESTLSDITNTNFVSHINVSGRDISMLFTPLTQNNPFTFAELANFKLPEVINKK